MEELSFPPVLFVPKYVGKYQNTFPESISGFGNLFQSTQMPFLTFPSPAGIAAFQDENIFVAILFLKIAAQRPLNMAFCHTDRSADLCGFLDSVA